MDRQQALANKAGAIVWDVFNLKIKQCPFKTVVREIY
jgi:hypothetical protein